MLGVSGYETLCVPNSAEYSHRLSSLGRVKRKKSINCEMVCSYYVKTITAIYSYVLFHCFRFLNKKLENISCTLLLTFYNKIRT